MIYSIDKPCYPIKPYISFSFPLTQTPSLCQIVKMFGLVGVIFALCWLPYHSYFIYSYFHPDIMKVKRTIIRRSDIISQITLQRYYQEHSDLPFPLDISLLFIVSLYQLLTFYESLLYKRNSHSFSETWLAMEILTSKKMLNS